MMGFRSSIFRAIIVLLLANVMYVDAHTKKSEQDFGIANKPIEKILAPVVIRVTGYAAFKHDDEKNVETQRLLAIRASKLDAYRALAERIYGISISGSSTIKDFALQSDGFATAVDSYVRGARVVSVIENKKTGMETVLEVLMPGDFQDCLNKVNSFKYGMECLQPFSESSNSHVEIGQTKKKSGQVMQSVYYLK